MRILLGVCRRTALTAAVVRILIAGAILLGLDASAPGVILDATSFVAVRHLVPPPAADPVATPDRASQSGGISGAGDVFGMVNSVRAHQGAGTECRTEGLAALNSSHCEDPIVWKRSEGYEGKVVFGGLPYFAPSFAFNLGPEFQSDLDGGAITQVIRDEWANQDLALADNAVLIVNEAGASWTIHEPATPQGCRNTGEPCREHLYEIANQSGELAVVDESPTKPHGAHVGTNGNVGLSNRHLSHVNEAGYAAGTWHVDNGDTYFYDIANDVFVNHSGGHGASVNNHKIVLSTFVSYSENPPSFVASPDAVTEDNPRGLIHVFDPPELLVASISDDNTVVGGNLNPFRIRSTGVDENGFPTYDAFNPATDLLQELGPSFSGSEAIAISTSSPYIVGTSFDFAALGNNGVVWDETTGNVIQKFGANRTPIGITDDGTIAFGSIRDVIGGAERAALWMTDDGWETHTELILDELLSDLFSAGVPGAERVAAFSDIPGQNSCCWVAGVNNLGQVVAQGLVAEGPALGSPGILGHRRPAPGGVFLLDTLELSSAVIKGDVNNDGTVDFLDITPFINAQSTEGDEDAFLLLTPDGCFLCADIDMDGAIDFLDITPFVNLLDELAAAVPEPATAALLIIGLVTMRRRTRKKPATTTRHPLSSQ